MHHQYLMGSIDVICGPMFSGKTEELIRRLKRAEIARYKIQIFKPKIDDRYHATKIVSHSSISKNAIAVHKASEIREHIKTSTKVVGIDEAQFFDHELIDIAEELANNGVKIILAGLDQDSDGRPFGIMPQLLAISDSTTKVQAVCIQCGQNATKSYRRKSTAEDQQILVGESDLYEARCRYHWKHDDLSEENDDHYRLGKYKVEKQESMWSQE